MRVTFRAPAVLPPDVDLVRPAVTAAASPWRGLRGAARPRSERKPGMSRARGDIRPDLEEVFRSDYPRVVAIAARVLGSRD